jgi:hypothetical protein
MPGGRRCGGGLFGWWVGPGRVCPQAPVHGGSVRPLLRRWPRGSLTDCPAAEACPFAIRGESGKSKCSVRFVGISPNNFPVPEAVRSGQSVRYS